MTSLRRSRSCASIQLTREIHALTQELHGVVLGTGSEAGSGSAPA